MMPIIKFHPDTYGFSVRCVCVLCNMLVQGELWKVNLCHVCWALAHFTVVEFRFNIPVVSLTQESNNLAWKTFYVHSIFADYYRWIPFKVYSSSLASTPRSVYLDSSVCLSTCRPETQFPLVPYMATVRVISCISSRRKNFYLFGLQTFHSSSSSTLYVCETLKPIPWLTWELYYKLAPEFSRSSLMAAAAATEKVHREHKLI